MRSSRIGGDPQSRHEQLVKLYVEESGSANVRRLVEQAEIVAASVEAYPEARADLARRKRERSLLSRFMVVN
jgi:hypothetical protein